MQKKKFWAAALLLALLAFAIPIEHKYDKLFRFFSLTLIPEGVAVSSQYDKKIYFYVSDLISLALLFLGLFGFRIPLKRFFGNALWIVFFCAITSIIASPFATYPIPYIRLLQLLTPIALFSFLAHAFNEEERNKITRLILWTLVIASLFQTAIAITQYFQQAPLGLRLLGESGSFSHFLSPNGTRWIFDRVSSHKYAITRTSGTLPHSNVLGGFLALSLLTSCALFMRAKKWRLFLGLTLPFQFFAMCTTFSRSALFGWALATLVWFGLIFYKNGIKDRATRLLALLVVLSVTISTFLLYDQFVQRGGVVNYSQTLAKGSDQGRITYQHIAFEIIKENPIFGLGFNQFSEHSAPYLTPAADPNTGPHNIYLFLACETGLISLFAFLFFIGALFWAAARTTLTLETATLTSIFILFLFIGGCDFYPTLFQQGKLMFFMTAGLLAAHLHFGRKSLPSNPPRGEVWKMFDQISPTYDRINRILSLGMDQRWRKQVAKHLPSLNHLKILDLATGTGDQALALLESGASIDSITGIDLSTEMLQIAKRKLGSRANCIRADAEKLPFNNENFNAATFSFGIRNVTDPVCSLKEIYRVLKPSGRCLILEFSLPPRPIRGFYLFYLRHLLPRIGGLLSRKPAAYRYLNQTIEHFPSGKDFSSLMQKAGFTHLRRIPMAFGGVTLYIGEKA